MNKNIDALSAERALKLALEALRDYRRSDDDRVSVAMGILQEALAHAPTEREQPAQQQQEPVAWVCYGWASDEKHAIDYEQHEIDAIPVGTLLYTSPPANANAGKPWVGLTPEECKFLAELQNASPTAIVRLTEAKLREKNT